MRDSELSGFFRTIGKATNNGDFPCIAFGVESGASWVYSGLAPYVELEYLDIGFEEVGKLAGGRVQGPGRWERDERKMVGGNRVVKRKRPEL